MSGRISRREFLRYAGTTVAAAAVAACAPAVPSAPEAPAAPEEEKAPAPVAEEVKIEFWSQTYGDAALWQELLQGLAGEFKEEKGITVDVQLINWSNAFNTWLLVSQGGAHPDGADMFWLYSHATLGGGKYGPMPITELQDELWPDLEERFYAGALKDVFWQGEFYGIPWRGDIRPMIYRVDMFEEAGFDRPPDTWEELAEFSKALTKRDDAGNVSPWGFTFGGAAPLQALLPFYWQAGGEFMTEDGRTATVDTPEMREALAWMYDMIWTHQVVPPDFMEKGFAPYDLFTGDQIAIIGEVPGSWGKDLDRDFPELADKWAMAIPAKGPKNRASYSGAGYWGVLHGTKYVRETALWIQFLSRDENMQKITEFVGHVSPNKRVMASPFWTDRPWKLVIGQTLEYAHTSQHPSPAWTKLVAPEPGSVLYDLYYEALVKQEPIDDVLKRAQQRMQEEMDKIQV